MGKYSYMNANSTMTNQIASLNINGKKLEMPIVEGSEKEQAIDVSALRKETGIIQQNEKAM